jgi:hypothetical protein
MCDGDQTEQAVNTGGRKNAAIVCLRRQFESGVLQARRAPGTDAQTARNGAQHGIFHRQ